MKLGFVHRRNVFEPPRLRFDDLPYTFDTSGKLISPESDENIVNTMLLEPPRKPVLARNGKRVSRKSIS